MLSVEPPCPGMPGIRRSATPKAPAAPVRNIPAAPPDCSKLTTSMRKTPLVSPVGSWMDGPSSPLSWSSKSDSRLSRALANWCVRQVMPGSSPVPTPRATSTGSDGDGVTCNSTEFVALNVPSDTPSRNVTLPLRSAYQVTAPLVGFTTALVGPDTRKY